MTALSRPAMVKNTAGFIATALSLAISNSSVAADCPLALAPASAVSGPLAGKAVRVWSGGASAPTPAAVAFNSGLQRDDDGAPNAYHRGLAGDARDPGLDPICVGGSVLEYRNGRLVNKYGDSGSMGGLSGVDPATRIGRTRLCKRDYIALRDAQFPACGPGKLCMIWYGVASTPRACGYPSAFGKADDLRCGEPIRQALPDGGQSDFYLTTTKLRRPGSPRDSHVQSDYADASVVPYLVMPGGLRLPVSRKWEPGDLVAVVWEGRTAWGVIGDTGPADKIGEASRAMLRMLNGGASVGTIDPEAPATTLVLPGTAARVMTEWPLNPAKIAQLGRAAAAAVPGGVAGLKACPGLAALH